MVVPFFSLRLDELEAEVRLLSLPALRAGILLVTEQENKQQVKHLSKKELLQNNSLTSHKRQTN